MNPEDHQILDEVRVGNGTESHESVQEAQFSAAEASDKRKAAELRQSVCSTLKNIGVSKRKLTSPKTALGAFSDIMQNKFQEQSQIDEKKLKLEQEKFEYEKMKDDRKWELEKLKLADAKNEREFELLKLEKLIELEKFKKK